MSKVAHSYSRMRVHAESHAQTLSEKFLQRWNGHETSAVWAYNLFFFLLQYVNGEKNAFVEFYAPCRLTLPLATSHHPSYIPGLFCGVENETDSLLVLHIVFRPSQNAYV